MSRGLSLAKKDRKEARGRKRVKGASATSGTVCTKCIPRAGEGGRASCSFPQEYPTNSIEVACTPSTNRVSLYLNACGNKRHVRIGTVRGLTRVKFPFSPLSLSRSRALSALSVALFPPATTPRGEFTTGNVSSSDYEYVLIITSDSLFFFRIERKK